MLTCGLERRIFLEFCCNFRVHGAECGLFGEYHPCSTSTGVPEVSSTHFSLSTTCTGILCVLWVVFAVATLHYTGANSRGAVSFINFVLKRRSRSLVSIVDPLIQIIVVAAVTIFWIDDKEEKAKPKESSRSNSESSSGDSESSSGDSYWLPLLKDATGMVSDVVGAATSN